MLNAFTPAQQSQIETLRAAIARRIQRTVTLDCGEDDHGGLWAALGVETLPYGSAGPLGTLVSVLAGAGIPGEAVVVSADGRTVFADGVDMREAVKAATFAGVREYRARTRGAFRRH